MIKQIIVISMLFLLLSACEPIRSQQTQYITPQCISSQSHCFVETAIGRFNITFDVEQIRSETEFHVSATYQGNEKIRELNGYVEGKNMYMGKIPLFFKKNKGINHYMAPLMLASCSESRMTWVLWLTAESTENESGGTVEFSSQGKQTTFFIEFNSQL